MFAGLLVTPVALDVIGTVAVYVPACSAPRVGVSVTVAGAGGTADRRREPTGWLPCQIMIVPTARPDSDPLPLFETSTVCAAGLTVPAVVVNDAVVAASKIVGALR